MGSIETKANILSVSAKLFAQKGYDSVSIKEICTHSKCNIAAVHYHFGSKNKLYRAIFQDFGKNKLHKLELILDRPKSAQDFKVRFELYLSQALSMIEEDPNVAKIILRDGHLANKLCKDIFKNTFFKLFQALHLFLTEAQRLGIISKKIDAHSIIQIVDSIICAKVFEQKELKRTIVGKTSLDAYDQKEWIRSILAILFDGFMEKKTNQKDRS